MSEAEIDTLRGRMKVLEGDLRTWVERRKALDNTGFFSFLSSGPDPDEVAVVEAEIAAVKADLLAVRRAFNEAREAIERAEAESHTRVQVAPSIDSEAEATRHLRVARALDHKLSELEGIAAKVCVGRANASTPMVARGRMRRVMPELLAAKDVPVRRHAGLWEPTLDEAEIMADFVGIELCLPRRFPGPPRPEGAARPSPDVAAARQAQITGLDREFGQALELVSPEVQLARTRCLALQEALLEKFPGAGGTAGGVIDVETLLGGEYKPVQRPAEGPGPVQELLETWEKLRALYKQLVKLRFEEARTVELLTPAGAWQVQARRANALLDAVGLDLSVPVNEGRSVAQFIDAVESVWIDTDRQFDTQIMTFMAEMS